MNRILKCAIVLGTLLALTRTPKRSGGQCQDRRDRRPRSSSR